MNLQKGVMAEKFIKEKMAKLLICIARLEWPQSWVNLVDELEVIARQGFAQKEVVLLALKACNYCVRFLYVA